METPAGFHLLPNLARIGFLLASVWPAVAADQSQWDGDEHASVRLIAAAPRQSATDLSRAGVEIKLAPGWKTYWRYPGDSGVPPRFDFSGSDNVASVAVAWPAPHRFADGGGQSIGYKDGVIFPLQVKRRDAGKPATLRLKLDYAICEKLCVPAEATLALPLADPGTSQNSSLSAAEARVPRRLALGAGGEKLSIVSAQRITNSGKPAVRVEIAGGTDADLFAEGPNAEWSLPLPAPLAPTGDGRQRFVFDLDGLPSGRDPNAPLDLKLTAVTASDAIETTVHLD
ncbi:MAG: protein-disulfide reductase DsbD domain-containing protein [Pseudorhodoplanes sp.]